MITSGNTDFGTAGYEICSGGVDHVTGQGKESVAGTHPEPAAERKFRPDQEDLAILAGLRPMDDDFMRCMFKDNLPLVEYVLRIIIGNGI